MHIISSLLKSPDLAKTPTAIALGNFDGLHIGHQRVIEQVLPCNLDCNLVSTVVTFSPHPREFFSQTRRSLLTPLAEKIRILAKLGIQQLVLLEFNAQLANLTAAEFMQQILQTQLQAQYLSVGFNFHFGANRRGSVADLQNIWGDRIHIAPEQLHHPHDDPSLSSIRVSSSSIREALSEGDVNIANRLLGRAYGLTGKVVEGDRLGRQLGFPTANLQLATDKFLPRFGVYAVWVDSDIFLDSVMGVMNIGMRPTIAGVSQQRIEVHLLGWQGDLYGTELSVRLVEFLRPEIKFDSLTELRSQIQTDSENARKLLTELTA